MSCTQAFHWGCAGLTEEDFNLISSTSNPSWLCDKCNKKNKSRRSTIFAIPSQPEEDTTPDFNELKALVTSLLERIEVVEAESAAKSAEVEHLKARVEILENGYETVEKHFIGDNLEIQNLPEVSLVDPIATVISIGEEIGCAVTATDFKTAPFRDHKRLRLPFVCKTLRRKFLVAGKQFNRDQRRFTTQGHSHRIHVNEELTTTQRNLFDKAKTFAKRNNYKFLWFDAGGRLLIKKDERSLPVSILSTHTLDDENILPKREGSPNEIAEVPPGGAPQ